MFLFLVKNRKWEYLSDGHYEAGNARLKAFLHPPMPEVLPVPSPRLAAPEPSRLGLSKDAELLRVLRDKLGGQRVSIFAALRSHAGLGPRAVRSRPWPSWSHAGSSGRGPEFIASISIYACLPLPPAPSSLAPHCGRGARDEGAGGRRG